MSQISYPPKAWKLLPEEIINELVFCSEGEQMLTQIFNMFFSITKGQLNQQQLVILQDIALSAWESALFSPSTASIVLAIHNRQAFLTQEAAAFCTQCASLQSDPQELSESSPLRSQNSGVDELKKELGLLLQSGKNPLYWFYYATNLGLQLGELDWYEEMLSYISLPPAFDAAVKADYAFARQDYTKAIQLYEKAFSSTHMTGYLVRKGECHFRIQEREEAKACWLKALSLRPWQSHLYHRLHDLSRGADIPSKTPKGKGEILFYTWNHGQDLDTALEAVYTSEIGDAGITLLNNASTDCTTDVIQGWQSKMGKRMQVLHLPINIGAPAARNWLLSLEQCKKADWLVYLDDDCIVPNNWLRLFGTALRLYPEAEIIGCRVLEKKAPLTIQSAAVHFRHFPEDEGMPYKIDCAQSLSPDFGQYSFLLPAMSVTGCCHLITRANIDSIGGFDIAFSPSQFDDFERDIRYCVTQQKFPLYQGHLAVHHIKRAGMSSNTSAKQAANIFGNTVKLRQSYPQNTFENLYKTDIEKAKEPFTFSI